MACPRIGLIIAICTNHKDKLDKQIGGTVICPPRIGTAVGSDHSLPPLSEKQEIIKQVLITEFVYPGRCQQLISQRKYNLLNKKGEKEIFKRYLLGKLVLLFD